MSGWKKKKLITFVSYFLVLVILLVPVIILNNKQYSFLTLGIRAAIDNRGVEIRVIIQSALLIIYFVITILYLLSCIAGRCFKLNLINVFVMIIFTGVHLDEPSMLTLCSNDMIGKMLVYLILLITVLECIVRLMPEKKTVEIKVREFKDNSVINQNKLFYHIIWKNFKKNWKDYVLVLICNIVLFAVTVVTFHMMQLLDGNYGIRKIQIFNGLSEILMNAMIPMGILSVFLIIMLVFYYLKMRAKNYGIFLTLGMYRKTLYYVTALEFGILFIIAFTIGAISGRSITSIIIIGIYERFGMDLSLQMVGMKPYLYSIAVISLIFLISIMAAKDIFHDFNVGKSEDMRGIAEKKPGKIRYIWTFVGTVICLYSIRQYRKLYQFENEYLLMIFFVGLFLIIRNGLVIYLQRERKKVSYLKKLLIHNQLYHKSNTSAGFITSFVIIHLCVLFYFTFQLNSVVIAEDIEGMFPYDFVFFADESDQTFIKELSEKYKINLYEYPMVRVTAYDSTEQMENQKAGTKTTQGQHIGISESTYHALKHQLNSNYEEKDLTLNANEKNIYVVYQQDKSVKAQPVSFYIPRSKALLHIGNPCTRFDIFGLNRIDSGYKNYQVTGREIGSLIGSFRQGVRENIIVFSDEYFDKAKDFWKTVNIRTGEIIEDENMMIPGITIAQGVTKLVLINAKEKDINQVYNELKSLEEKHKQMEDELYRTITPYGNWTSGVYDSTVSYVYAKHETMESIEIERIMKGFMSIAAIGLFIVMNFMVLIVKMLSEMELNIRRQEFLKCLGMPKKERVCLITNEYTNYFCYLPLILASFSTIIFTNAVFDARIYSSTDINNYLKYYIPAYVLYLIICIFITRVIIYVYLKKIEKSI